MKYLDFYNLFKNRALIDIRELRLIMPSFDSRRLFEWHKKAYIKKIARLFYVFSDRPISDFERFHIANKLVEPSYISNESALRYYDLIPEMVYVQTSVTSRKTRLIDSPIGSFQYRSIKENLMFGYRLVRTDAITFKMADPEKALLDFFYLRSDINDNDSIEELRLNAEIYRSLIDQDKLKSYLAVFDSPTLNQKVDLLTKIMCYA